ncbi:hypothetical protein [Mobilicoccus pelagius]|uniref:Uncharacterized protein n=1 Tax=Mobilicoccus pelagius NBRC 104925 TaxID=1089455 RepID=H5UUB8_9MICO|nr:hypothetical protein [Mobilicoccus pelagius]GAB49326.1 hypothetical protein MOPEL_113_00060 [Mobilicoccus pelagius NBRC 104925]
MHQARTIDTSDHAALLDYAWTRSRHIADMLGLPLEESGTTFPVEDGADPAAVQALAGKAQPVIHLTDNIHAFLHVCNLCSPHDDPTYSQINAGEWGVFEADRLLGWTLPGDTPVGPLVDFLTLWTEGREGSRDMLEVSLAPLLWDEECHDAAGEKQHLSVRGPIAVAALAAADLLAAHDAAESDDLYDRVGRALDLDVSADDARAAADELQRQADALRTPEQIEIRRQ